MTDLQERAANQFASDDRLHILFFFDPEEEHREEIEAWDHDTITVVTASAARFGLHRRLEDELAGTPVFLYVPEPRPSDWNDEPLADLWTANRELRIDHVAEFMETYNLPAGQRDVVQRYYKGELEHQNRQRFLAAILTPGKFTKDRLQRGLAAYHAKETFPDVRFSTVPKMSQLLAALIIGAQDEDAFSAYQASCNDLELDDFLGMQLSNQFDLDTTAFTHDTVREAAETMKYNLLMRPVETVKSDDRYRSRQVASTVLLNQLQSLWNEWKDHRALEARPETVLDTVAHKIDETHLTDVYGPDTTFGYLTPALRTRRLEQALRTVAHQPGAAKEAVEPLRGAAEEDTHFDGAVQCAAEVVWQIGALYQGILDYEQMVFPSLQTYVDRYSSALSRTDMHYRKAIAAYRMLKRTTNESEQLQASVRESVDTAFTEALQAYTTRFVQPLNRNWQHDLEADPEALADSGTTLQGQFYATYLASDEHKTAVIVSDALRYEVARELSSRMLKNDTRKSTTLKPMLAALPTVTSIGMAHLLPHTSITLHDGTPHINGQSTEGTSNRSAIIEEAHSSSACARRFDDIADLNRSEGRELFKAHRLVYIYHNRIDAIGDKRETESDAIEAVDDTLDELQQLVRTLNNWNVYRVVLVSDHGFLYMDEALPESMIESFPEEERPAYKCNRSIVADHLESDGGYRFPLRAVSNIDSDAEVGVPRAVNRYRLSGAGKRFAHGGASLQEMVVPALVVMKARKDKAKKVGVRLLSQDRVIKSSGLKVRILQREAVSDAYAARTVTVGLYDGDKLISDEERLELNATVSDATERTEKVMLTLGSAGNDLNFCHLRIYDVNDDLNPIVEQKYSIQRLIDSDF